MILPFVMLLSAQAPATAVAPVAQPAAVKPAKPKLICETEEEIGSRLGGKRVCRTKEQWDQLRHDSRQSLEAKQNQTYSGSK